MIFQTRWVMSYLAGPLTRDQIKRLTPRSDPSSTAAPGPTPIKAAQVSSRKAAGRPMLPPGIKQYFLPPDAIPAEDERVVYTPFVISSVRAAYSNSRVKVDERREFMLLAPTSDGPIDLDWNDADEVDLEVSDLGKKPVADAGFSETPAALSSTKSFTRWQKNLKTWLREEKPITIFRSPHLREYSRPEEDERDFRIRLQQLGNDARDIKVAKLRKRYEGRVARLEERLRRAQQAVDREAEQARGSKVDTAISFGTAVLGAVLGRKRISTTSASKVGTAMRKAGRMRQQSADVRRAKETVESVKAQLETLQIQFDEEVDALDAAYDAQDEELTETLVKPKSTGIEIRVIGVGWLPSIEAAE